MDGKEMSNLARSLRESATTFRKHQTHELPAMTGFIRRHVDELMKAAQALDEAAIEAGLPTLASALRTSE
jgi:uncharacterized protein YqgV (UPF0045/DUF77 family)